MGHSESAFEQDVLINTPHHCTRPTTAHAPPLQAVESGLEESVAEMIRPIPWVFQYSSEAVERCTQLTGGWGFNGLIKTLQVCLVGWYWTLTFDLCCCFFCLRVLVQHISHVSTSLHQVRRLYALQAGEEWIHVFNLIQLSGDMLLRTHTLAEELNSAIINSISKLQQPSSPSSPFGYYDYLAVYHPEERTAAMQLLNTCQKGVHCCEVLECRNFVLDYCVQGKGCGQC